MKHFTRLILMFVMFASFGIAQAQSNSRTITTDFPFEITTDATNPIYYYIYSGRDGQGGPSGFVFSNEIPYKETEYKLNIVYRNPNKIDPCQLWYFMEENGCLKIICAADNRMITVPNTNDAPQCVWMQTEQERTNPHYLWKLDIANNYYAFKTSDDRTFLSHNGNWSTAKSQMGLYNANGNDDDGSRVFFEALPKNDYTAIPGISAHPAGNNDVIYTICGRRIDKITAPGIYIRNGKKFIVRP